MALRSIRGRYLFTGGLILAVVLAASAPGVRAEPVVFDWRTEWQVADGFSISRDSDGYELPTAIAFVPDPGPGPKDPLYFVCEIRGRIKVVTNDRSVFTFAEVNASRSANELPHLDGETGAGAITLDPVHGYVFVSYAYPDTGGELRNGITRFEAQPGVFGLQPTSSTSFHDILANHPSHQSHQIGPMVVRDGFLFVSVGDARQSSRSRDVDSPLGKVLRMTLDGDPVPDNPFYVDSDRSKPRNYVWAYGLRNPFGLTTAGGQLFATDNGPDVDRFLRIERGEDYKYDGTNWSIGTRADVVFSPAVGPVTARFLPRGSELFPAGHRSRFYIALGGFLGAPPGAGRRGDRSVVTIPWDFEAGHALNAPEPFLQYRGEGIQLPVGLEFGPDGLYVVPLLPDAAGQTAILKIRYDPANEHPFLISRNLDGRSIMFAKGCFGCHSLVSSETMYGPSLDNASLVSRLSRKLNSSDYLGVLDRLDARDEARFTELRPAREKVRQAEDEDRIRAYVIEQILHPGFDVEQSRMPNLGISEQEAVAISDYLLETKQGRSRGWVPLALVRWIPQLRWRHLAIAFVAGAGLSLVVVVAFVYGIARLRRARGFRLGS